MPLFAAAPGFHLAGGWAGRLQLGPPWREASEAEQATLVAAEAGPGLVQLFQLPGHLREAFWALLEGAGGLPAEEARGFFGEVARFLEYKQFAPPTGSVYEVVAGLQGKAAPVPPPPGPPAWGAANLGNEATHAVFALGDGAVRLRLGPGEGYRLPAGGAPVASCTEGKEEPELLLVVRQAR